MDKYRVIEVKQSIFSDNNADAERLRQQMKSEKTFLINLMSSPGSGKTAAPTAAATKPGCKREMKSISKTSPLNKNTLCAPQAHSVFLFRTNSLFRII